MRLEVFSQGEYQRIHDASLYILKNKGVVFRSDEAVSVLKQNGASADGNTVFLPDTLIEKCLKNAPGEFKIHAINGKQSRIVGRGMLFHPAGGEVFIKRADGSRAESVMQDFIDFQKVYQACGNIDFTGYQPLSPNDVPLRTRGLECFYQTALYTDKPWLSPMEYVGAKYKSELLDLYEIVFGADFMRDNCVTWNVACPESPLVYSDLSCEAIIEYSKRGQPTALVSAPMSGITSPIHPLGTIVLQNCEFLAGMCLARCVKDSVPLLPSASLTFGNLKQASWECACPDTALMVAGAVQMYRSYYNLPTRAQTGVTSSKSIDYQAGFETMQSLLLSALAGVNVTSQSAGSLENLMTASLEKTVIDDEILSRVKRIVNGIDFCDNNLSIDVIMDINHGGDYLTHPNTLDNLRSGWYPSISDWDNYEKWSAKENRDIEQKAAAAVSKILDESTEPILEREIAERIRKYIDNVE